MLSRRFGAWKLLLVKFSGWRSGGTYPEESEHNVPIPTARAQQLEQAGDPHQDGFSATAAAAAGDAQPGDEADGDATLDGADEHAFEESAAEDPEGFLEQMAATFGQLGEDQQQAVLAQLTEEELVRRLVPPPPAPSHPH